MRLSLKQLKKDLRTVTGKRRPRSRFGEDPIEVKKISSMENMKNKFKDAPWKKIGLGLVGTAAVLGAAAGAHHIAKNTQAGRALTSSVTDRVNYEKDKVQERVNHAKNNAEDRISAARIEAKDRSDIAKNQIKKAVESRAERINKGAVDTVSNVNEKIGAVKIKGYEEAAKLGEAWHKSNTLNNAMLTAADRIAPSNIRAGGGTVLNKKSSFFNLSNNNSTNNVTDGVMNAVLNGMFNM